MDLPNFTHIEGESRQNRVATDRFRTLQAGGWPSRTIDVHLLFSPGPTTNPSERHFPCTPTTYLEGPEAILWRAKLDNEIRTEWSKRLLLLRVSASQRSRLTQAASRERLAPSGSKASRRIERNAGTILSRPSLPGGVSIWHFANLFCACWSHDYQLSLRCEFELKL